MSTLIKKYAVAAPRYTSYPTVPYWQNDLTEQEQWQNIVKDTFSITNDSEGISLYLHLPFCESLCTYCGCNTRITINHNVETPYITAILKEWEMYLKLFATTPRIKELHLGGGTPTFFKPQNLQLLIEGILSSAILCNDAEMSFEAHPANTTAKHLETLYKLGFTRLSLGIQDFDEKVQHIINRKQSFDSVKNITQQARSIGYTSINYDLIYGLPLQTKESMEQTIEKVIELHPDRIAFYSYAHVPWLKPGQRKFTESDLPPAELKRTLYENSRNAFEKAGYTEIGMDHFALPDDPLCIAQQNKTLHRNFMGYTASHTQLLIGLGVSSISDAYYGYAQNEKKVEDYYSRIEQGQFPLIRGHIMTQEDVILRKHILNILCKQQTSWFKQEEQCDYVYTALEHLRAMADDNLVVIHPSQLTVTPMGKTFLRNVAMAFDARLWRQLPATQLFSSAV